MMIKSVDVNDKHAQRNVENVLSFYDLMLNRRKPMEAVQKYLAPGNVEKTVAAPITAIIGYDGKFYELLPKLFPHADARSWLANTPELAEVTARRNGSLQGAYIIIAARAVGLD